MRVNFRSRLLTLNLPAAGLLLLLQRTPVARVVSSAAELSAPSRIVALLKSAFATAATLGAVHSLAGATAFSVTRSGIFGTVGTPITPVAFTVNGAAVPPGSFRIGGTLPPGIFIVNLDANGVLNASVGAITGTPSATGSYQITVLAYERINATGDAFGPISISFTIADAPARAPAITVQPASQSVVAGATVTFGVAANGSPEPGLQWRRDGTPLAGATASTLTLTDVQAGNAGTYTVVVSNSAGSVTSNPAMLTVSVAAGAPTITTQPLSQFVTPGTPVTFSVAATGGGLNYQWKRDGAAIGGANLPTLALAFASENSVGFYSVAISNSAGATESAVATLNLKTGGTSRLINVSTRGFVPAGGSLTPGFVLQGNASKVLVIRAVGPTLGAFGVGGTLADPVMDVIPLGATAAIATNDNWGGAAALQSAFSRIGAFPLMAASSTDASVETSLRATGATGYTVRITSKNPAASGIALAEVYDEDALGAPVRLLNVSTIGFVGTGQQALVPGFVIGGTASKLLLIRAVGPGLAPFGVGGVLADPQLSVAPLGREFAAASNNDWGNDPALSAAFTASGAFALPVGSKDAVVVVRLPPGGYTVVVSGTANTTGTALVEIYDLDP